MTIKLKPCQRKNPKLLKSHDYWGGSTSVSLPVFLTVVPGFKKQLPVGLSIWSETDLKAISQYLQANVKTHLCHVAEYSEWIFPARNRSRGQHKGDMQEVVDKSKSGNTGARMSLHPPATLTVTWPLESSQYLRPVQELCKEERGQGSFPLTLALPHRPKSPEWGCIMVL